jgi:hypothetical protein
VRVPYDPDRVELQTGAALRGVRVWPVDSHTPAPAEGGAWCVQRAWSQPPAPPVRVVPDLQSRPYLVSERRRRLRATRTVEAMDVDNNDEEVDLVSLRRLRRGGLTPLPQL